MSDSLRSTEIAKTHLVQIAVVGLLQTCREMQAQEPAALTRYKALLRLLRDPAKRDTAQHAIARDRYPTLQVGMPEAKDWRQKDDMDPDALCEHIRKEKVAFDGKPFDTALRDRLGSLVILLAEDLVQGWFGALPPEWSRQIKAIKAQAAPLFAPDTFEGHATALQQARLLSELIQLERIARHPEAGKEALKHLQALPQKLMAPSQQHAFERQLETARTNHSKGTIAITPANGTVLGLPASQLPAASDVHLPSPLQTTVAHQSVADASGLTAAYGTSRRPSHGWLGYAATSPPRSARAATSPPALPTGLSGLSEFVDWSASPE